MGSMGRPLQSRRLVCALVLAAAIVVAFRTSAGESSPAERERAVEIARRLERDPLGREADRLRAEGLAWWKKADDLRFRWCSKTTFVAPELHCVCRILVVPSEEIREQPLARHGSVAAGDHDLATIVRGDQVRLILGSGAVDAAFRRRRIVSDRRRAA